MRPCGDLVFVLTWGALRGLGQRIDVDGCVL